MPEAFVLYQKFTDINIAEELAAVLKSNGIDFHLQDNLHSYVNIVGFTHSDLAIGLNLRSEDFTKADSILENYYLQEVEKIDKDYYLFDFTDTELREIISNPYDWGQFDYQLAKHLLKEKGEAVTDIQVQKMKDKRINELSKMEKVNSFKLISGYILTILLPVVAIIIGMTIIYNRNLLPNGQKFYIHTEKERNHGRTIVAISIAWICIALLLNYLNSR